jgi:hypothetical protein
MAMKNNKGEKDIPRAFEVLSMSGNGIIAQTISDRPIPSQQHMRKEKSENIVQSFTS